MEIARHRADEVIHEEAQTMKSTQAKDSPRKAHTCHYSSPGGLAVALTIISADPQKPAAEVPPTP
jgi:hypothetical protein